MEQGIRFENKYISLRYGEAGAVVSGRGAEERAGNTARHMEEIEREDAVGEALFQVWGYAYHSACVCVHVCVCVCVCVCPCLGDFVRAFLF
jgi:hypothetical protein